MSDDEQKFVDTSTGERATLVSVPLGYRASVYPDNGKTSAGGLQFVDGEAVRRDQRLFTKQYDSAWQAVFENHVFRPSETQMLMCLGAYCERESNVAMYHDRPMNVDDLCRLLEWTDRNVRLIGSSLQDKNAIFHGGRKNNERYVVNPELFGKGTYVNPTLRRLFWRRKNELTEDAKGMLSFMRIGRNESSIVLPSDADK